MDDNATPDPHLIDQTVEIVCAYARNNHLPAAELPGLIATVYAGLSGIANPAPPITAEAEIEKPSPAAIKKSITPDAIISFIDGKPYKTLRRHLTTHGLTPETYRARYGLPADYPLVSPNYSAQRSALAKELGLGQPTKQVA